MAYIREIKRKDREGRAIRTGRWVAQIYLGRDPATNKTRWEVKTFDKRTEAKAWVSTVEVKRNDGAYRPTSSKATFAEYIRDTWLPMYCKRRPRSAYTTQCTMNRWIFSPPAHTPLLGPKKLRDLSVEHFDALYVAMEEKHGMSERGIRFVHTLLRLALKHAVVKKHLSANPTDGATVPSGKLGPVRYLTEEQEARFLVAAKQDRLAALWLLLLDTGLRPGEAYALKWEGKADDSESWIDLKAKLVRVRTSLTRMGVDKKVEGWKVTDPKTPNSKRDVPICEDTVAALERWAVEQKKERLKAGPEWQRTGFVFTTELGTPLGNNVRRAWAAVMRVADGGRGDLGTWKERERKVVTRKTRKGRTSAKCSLGPKPEPSFTPRYSPYVLRHTMATLAYLDGMDLGLLSRRLGHATYGFTFDRYGRGVKAEHTKAVADNTQRRWRASTLKAANSS